MKSRHQFWTGTICAICFFVLILDAQTALYGAEQGINLCLYTVIPSLFPFFVVSTLINSSLSSKIFRFVRPVSKLAGIPSGSEPIFVLGFLGGYPVGAQSIADAHKNKKISTQTAHRMLGFCNNAGPAFIFGMIGSLFDNPKTTWVLWMIHIISALFVGIILPRVNDVTYKPSEASSITVSQALEKCIKTMATVCGWIVIFQVILAFLRKWVFWLIRQEFYIWCIGIIELSICCFELHTIPSMGIRFVVIAGMLGFGGICIAMQTMSVTKDLGTGYYFPGKILQGCLSIFLGLILQKSLFEKGELLQPGVLFYIVLIGMISVCAFIIYKRKNSRFSHLKRV